VGQLTDPFVMSWRRIAITALLLAIAAPLVLLAPLASEALEEWREREAAQPRPIPVSDAQQAQIARAIVDSGAFKLVPPPDAAGAAKTRSRAWVVDRTVAMGNCPTRPEDVAFCTWSEMAAEELRVDDYYPGLPRRWRLELIEANSSEQPIADPGSSDVTWISSDVAVAVNTPVEWDVLRAGDPALSGFLRLSRAVLSPDHGEALVYAEHHWPLSFEGPSRVVFRLRAAGNRWVVLTQQYAGANPMPVRD
jgi:hypothetical protein